MSRIDRRLSASVIAGMLMFFYGTVPAYAQSGSPLPAVRPIEWSIVTPDQVNDVLTYRPAGHNGQNQSLAYYLAHFHRLANAVRDQAPDRGFIELDVWRRPRDNEPHNARIMENIHSLAWLYSRDEPWNPYYGDEATRRRMEAAMEFWTSIQDPDGRFSEYAPQRWNLASTAFATKFMSEALIQLQNAPPIDPDVYEKIREANRNAILLTLNDDAFWEHGQRFTNQYENVYAGAMGYLHLYEDPEVARSLRRQMVKSAEAFQSPAGYMYENHGPDWGYYFGTHHSNLHMAWHYGRNMEVDGADLTDLIRDEYERSTEWLSYNAVPQPGGGVFMLNRSIESRGDRPSFYRLETPLSEFVPLARAFSLTEEERRDRLTWSRQELETDWGNPPALTVGESSSYSPYAFIHREHHRWYPTERQRQEAFAQLPYNARDRFVHQRRDSRNADTYTYVRRPGYYLALSSGPLHTPQQRRGAGLFWHPEFGTLIQSQTESTDFAWGTRRLSDDSVREASDVDARFTIDGREVAPEIGARDLPEGELVVNYSTWDGRKTLEFQDRAVRIRVNEGGRFVEQIPLMFAEGDRLSVQGQRVRLIRDGASVLEIQFQGAEEIQVLKGAIIEGLTVTAIHAPASQSLEYEIRMQP